MAVFRAIAAILLHFGVEKDAEQGKAYHEKARTVAARLYKFMQRATE